MSSIRVIRSAELPAGFFSVRRLSGDTHEVPVILDAVRTHGDAGIREYAAKYDRANPVRLEIDRDSLRLAAESLQRDNPELYAALVHSRELALAFARRQRESFDDFDMEIAPALVTGQRSVPVERAGIYVPAGRFPLFSSVIMGSVPAQAAGVDEVILCTPPAPHPSDPALPWADERIMAVAFICGLDRVFAVGGAQAIGAMAYGTETVPRVNVIVGPGNKYVAAAKKAVYGEVGIDLLAGPTEVMVIADGSANPRWVAADLLAQAEHDPDAEPVLLTVDERLARAVAAEVDTLVAALPDRAPARASFAKNGLVVLVRDWAEAAEIANRKAPEHLELSLESGPERDALERAVRNYGSLFVGHRSAEVLGDYAGGLNHTLPTSGSAAFTGGLSVRHFLKTVTVLRSPDGVRDFSGWRRSLATARVLAEAEGLSGHALAARCREE